MRQSSGAFRNRKPGNLLGPYVGASCESPFNEKHSEGSLWAFLFVHTGVFMPKYVKKVMDGDFVLNYPL